MFSRRMHTKQPPPPPLASFPSRVIHHSLYIPNPSPPLTLTFSSRPKPLPFLPSLLHLYPSSCYVSFFYSSLVQTTEPPLLVFHSLALPRIRFIRLTQNHHYRYNTMPTSSSRDKVIKTVRVAERVSNGGEDKGKNTVKMSERAASFHSRNPASKKSQLRRPKTEPELLSGRKLTGVVLSPESLPKLSKLLLNVTIENSLVAVHVVIAPEAKVGDLIAAAVRQYVKEGRRPFLPTNDAARFDLHYSQFSLESLDRDTRLGNLGSRNFFMCCSKNDGAADNNSASTCSNQAETASTIGFPWLRIKEFFT